MAAKECRRCRQTKPFDAFYRCEVNADLLHSWCKPCCAEAARERYAAKKDHHLALGKAWRTANREVMKKLKRDWARAHPESAKRWRDQNRDAARATVLRYRARKQAAFVEDVSPSAVYTRDNGFCGICSAFVPEEALSVDHIIPLSKGGEHSYANVQLAHRTCNSSKRDALLVKGQ